MKNKIWIIDKIINAINDDEKETILQYKNKR